jgi:hypothetical protein
MALRLLLVGMVASLGLDIPMGWRIDKWDCVGRDWLEARQIELQELTETRPLIVDARVDAPAGPIRPLIVETQDGAAEKVAARPDVIEVIEEPQLVTIPEPTAPVLAAPKVAELPPPVPPAERKATQLAEPANVVGETAVTGEVPAPESRDAMFAAVVDKMVAAFTAPVETPSNTELLAALAPQTPREPAIAGPVDEAAVTLEDAGQPATAATAAEPPPPPAPAAESTAWAGATAEEAREAAMAQDRVVAPKSASRNERLMTAVRLTRQAISAWAGLLDQDADVVAVQH